MKDTTKLIIYTDGSAIDNNNTESDSKCGWAYKFIYDDGSEDTDCGSDVKKTNNQMEMTAVMNALRAVTNKAIPIELYSDSKYVIETLNGNYQMHKNQELWKELLEEKAKFETISFFWVKGHDKNKHNKEVDAMAQEQAKNASANE